VTGLPTGEAGAHCLGEISRAQHQVSRATFGGSQQCARLVISEVESRGRNVIGDTTHCHRVPTLRRSKK